MTLLRTIVPAVRRSLIRTNQYPLSILKQVRFASTESPDVEKLAEQICSLTLIETASLVETLKSRLGIQELSMAPAAPSANATASKEDGSGDNSKSAAAEKSIFNIKLETFNTAMKAKMVKEVKSLFDLNLVAAKKLVESCPVIIKEGVTKDDASKLKEALEAAGGVIILE